MAKVFKSYSHPSSTCQALEAYVSFHQKDGTDHQISFQRESGLPKRPALRRLYMAGIFWSLVQRALRSWAEHLPYELMIFIVLLGAEALSRSSAAAEGSWKGGKGEWCARGSRRQRMG
jgi:hypothetical protein